jgi:ubiquinone/menaquinone biosynthesis C-methylase UbiE
VRGLATDVADASAGIMTTEQAVSPAHAYESYFGPAIFQPLAELLVEHARPRASEAVLDVACGTGIVTRRVAALVGAHAQVVGVDLNPAMIDVAKVSATERSEEIDFHQGDATKLDLPDHAFDLVTCQQGLQFFSDRAAGAAEMRRVLRDTGRVVIAVWQGLDRHPLYAALAEAEAPHLAALGVSVTPEDLAAPFSFGDPDELARLIADAGFSDVEVVQDSISARFGEADRFVERMEYAYAAVVPRFAEDPAAFATYLDAIDRATRSIVDSHRDGDEVVVPMHTNIAIAHA